MSVTLKTIRPNYFSCDPGLRLNSFGFKTISSLFIDAGAALEVETRLNMCKALSLIERGNISLTKSNSIAFASVLTFVSKVYIFNNLYL